MTRLVIRPDEVSIPVRADPSTGLRTKGLVEAQVQRAILRQAQGERFKHHRAEFIVLACCRTPFAQEALAQIVQHPVGKIRVPRHLAHPDTPCDDEGA